MKYHFIFWIGFCWSHWTLANTYENPFGYGTEATTLTISAFSAGVAPFTYQNVAMAGQLARVQQIANATGISVGLPNRHREYLNANPYGASGRQRIAEEIGEMGARRFAQQANYVPIYLGMPGKGRGFDQVYQFGKQIIVVEAKGGNSPLKVYRGYLQGTPKYTLAVAKEILTSKTASKAAKQAAKAVIKAYREGRLVVQASHTSHVYGKPGSTTVQTTYGQVDISPLKVAHQTSMRVGVAGALLGGAFELATQLATGQKVNWKEVGSMTLLGGISGYASNMAGTSVQNILATHQSRLASLIATRVSSPLLGSIIGGVSSGMVASAVFAYGSYLLGYADLTTANRSMTAGVIGTAAGALAGSATFALVTTFGTASTGTAIGSLSGAAATNATLAWLGGGSIAAGGGGVAAGSIVLTAGAAAIVIAATAGVMYLYTLGDTNTERERVGYLVASVQEQLQEGSLN